MIKEVTIATRNSPMALWQAHNVKNKLIKIAPNLKVNIKGMLSDGDINTSATIKQLGGKQVFVKTLQKSLLANDADIAVHCIKDMAVHQPKALTVAAILPRSIANDALITPQNWTIETLPIGATVGTGSPRRSLLLKKLRPDIIIKGIRGNVNTRLAKLEAKQYDAIMLSACGLQRLEKTDLIQQILPIDTFIPAIGQGALGIECLDHRHELISLMQQLNNSVSQQQIIAEQTVNRILQGDCHSPIGAHATCDGSTLHLNAIVGNLKTQESVTASAQGPIDDAISIGRDVANQLIKLGAKALLA